jgi:hypothetical protein
LALNTFSIIAVVSNVTAQQWGGLYYVGDSAGTHGLGAGGMDTGYWSLNEGNRQQFIRSTAAITSSPTILVGSRNGVPARQLWVNGTAGSAGAYDWGYGGNVAVGAGYAYFIGDVAEILVYDTYLSDSNRQRLETYLFGRYAIDAAEGTRYPTGSYTVLTKTAEAAARCVTGVDWAGTFGANYGSLYRVQVNTGTDVSPSWVTVGGDNPTSPITGLDLTVPAGTTRWVRVYMEPRANATRSATPILTAMRVTHESTAGAPRIYAPQRFGPYLLPIGGLL